MKKIISFMLVAVLLAVMCVSVASADKFVESITYKPAPELVVGGGERPVIGNVVDPNGDILTEEYHDCIVITPVSEAETSTKIPADAAKLLLDVYAEISADGYKFASMSDELNKMVASDLGEGCDADDLVVRDLFDVTVLCDELKENLAPVGNTLTLTFKVSVDKDTPVYVMTYKGGKWAPIVKTVNNGDGTISCTFEDFCPVVFMVPTENPDDTPQTGDTSDNTFWVVVMVSATLLIAALVAANVYSYKRSRV